MFLPESQKKLTNVSVVSIRKFGKRYEVAVYPNKLYEYRNGITTTVSEIVHTDQIFTNVSKGEVCPDSLLQKFNKPKHRIIEEILLKGIEQKDTKTRNFELKKAENEIVHFIQTRILNKGKYMNVDTIRKLLRSFKIEPGNSKTQAQSIIKALTKMGYEKIKMIIEVADEKEIPRIAKEVDSEVVLGTIIKISTDAYREFKSFCAKNNIRFKILENEEVDEEYIC